MSDEVKLVLIGGMSQAHASGEMTLKALRRLDDLMGSTFRCRFASVLELASFGDVASDAQPAPPRVAASR